LLQQNDPVLSFVKRKTKNAKLMRYLDKHFRNHWHIGIPLEMVGVQSRIFTPGIRGAEAVERPFPACVPLTSEEFRQE
jgi:hypothetical protein